MRAGPAALVLVAAALVACTSGPGPDRLAAQAWFDALADRDARAAAAATTDSAAAASVLSASFAALPGVTPAYHVDAVRDRRDTSASVAYTATWTFPGAAAPWRWSSTLPVTRTGSTWRVVWSPTALAPGLAAGQHLGEARTQPTRANLLDRSGQPLFTATDVVTVGIDASQTPDVAALAAELAAVPQLQSTAAEISAAVAAQPAGQFVEVVTLRADVYAQVRDRIHDLQGTVFRQGTELLGPAPGFAQPLLGQVGPATAEQVEAAKGAVVAGDVVGQGGLQAALNGRLGGTPGIAVTALDGAGTVAGTLATVTAPAPGTDVTLTLDRTAQTAADATVAGVPLPAALVVTQPSTGQVLAVADNAAADGDIALTGQYPPGSTFKIATYTAVFDHDPAATPDTSVDCPGTTTVDGQTVTNEDGFAKGAIPLADAFAFSCNTSAASLALQLPAGTLRQAAASLGLGQTWDLPVDAFSGSMPTDAQSNELAAEGYGQGETLVSPLLMAEMAGGAASGTAIAPSLVMGSPGAALARQDPRVTGYLNTLMRDVVTVPGATGRLLAPLPGPVQGKTGTAEFGTDVPPRAHSWFAGTRGDLAFAVFVAGGENSDTTAVPLAKAFLSAYPAS